MLTHTAIRQIIRTVRRHDATVAWRDADAVVRAILRADAAEDLADAMRVLGLRLPLCACGCCCVEDATRIESDSGEPMCATCCDYAVGEDGEVVCARDDRYEDDGEWTGGGMHGCGTGWVSRPRVRDADE